MHFIQRTVLGRCESVDHAEFTTEIVDIVDSDPPGNLADRKIGLFQQLPRPQHTDAVKILDDAGAGMLPEEVGQVRRGHKEMIRYVGDRQRGFVMLFDVSDDIVDLLIMFGVFGGIFLAQHVFYVIFGEQRQKIVKQFSETDAVLKIGSVTESDRLVQKRGTSRITDMVIEDDMLGSQTVGEEIFVDVKTVKGVFGKQIITGMRFVGVDKENVTRAQRAGL